MWPADNFLVGTEKETEMPSKEGEVPGKEGAGSGLSLQEVKVNILWVWSTNVHTYLYGQLVCSSMNVLCGCGSEAYIIIK